jgi:putative SOS response-associated peptidase YedK
MLAAGLYETWGDAGQISCTMLTKPASKELHCIHPRMPVLLTRETLRRWISETNQESEQWLQSAEHCNLVYWPVSTAVGNVKNDAPQLIEPIDA